MKIESKQKDQTSMCMDGINHYILFNVCIIHNEAEENSFLAQYILYRINKFSS